MWQDDKNLVEALKQGNVSAFEHIYKTYYDHLLNYADRLLQDFESARDIVQEVYYKVWENRQRLDITISVRSYLFKSVYNHSVNTLTHQKYVREYEEAQVAELYYSAVEQTPESELNLWREDIEKAVDEAMAKLPDKCREVFTLSKIEGLKNREIAEKLNISEKTVERHISIALSRLRDELSWLLQLVALFSLPDWG